MYNAENLLKNLIPDYQRKISKINTMEIQNLRGNSWSARKVDSIYIVSVDNQSNIVETLTDFIRNQDIYAGEVTGIGAVSEATLRF